VTPAEEARFLALSADARAAYVAGPGRASIAVLELPAPQAPRSIHKIALEGGGGPMVALSAASRAAMLALVRASDVLMFDTTSPLHPARGEPRALPAGVRDARVVAAELAPDGKALAALTADGNRLVLLDLVPRGKAEMVAELALAPETRVGILIDVAFSPDGQTLWVLAGDTAASRPIGPQAT